MGFCRRCGDIVVGPRCKCGGTSVAPVVKWTQNDGQQAQDSWSKTYVTRDKSPSKVVQRNTTGQDFHASTSTTSSSPSGSPVKRFPRPTNQKPIVVSLDQRVSEHIATFTSIPRPPSPLKHSTTASNSFTDAFQIAMGSFTSNTGASCRVIATLNHMRLSVSHAYVCRTCTR
ncbi:hypothetical protein C8Q76DRAFT_278041 [Earliella scabrosa]|nr:hypothetical protein C8Q76DRAFT_278041 [Earliella scabrosa]